MTDKQVFYRTNRRNTLENLSNRLRPLKTVVLREAKPFSKIFYGCNDRFLHNKPKKALLGIRLIVSLWPLKTAKIAKLFLRIFHGSNDK